MNGQALNCKRISASTAAIAISILLCGSQFLFTPVAEAAQENASPAANYDNSPGTNHRVSESPHTPDPDQQLASWGLDIGFVQNGPRYGVMLQGNAPRFGSPWIPQLGISIQTISIEGHLVSDTSNSSTLRGAEFFALTAKFANPYTRGFVRPYGVAKVGALLTSEIASSKAVAAGYVGFGGEFLFNQLVQGMFDSNIRENLMAFFIEMGVPITGDQVQANLIQGSPYIFNGISMTVGMKRSF